MESMLLNSDIPEFPSQPTSVLKKVETIKPCQLLSQRTNPQNNHITSGSLISHPLSDSYPSYDSAYSVWPGKTLTLIAPQPPTATINARYTPTTRSVCPSVRFSHPASRSRERSQTLFDEYRRQYCVKSGCAEYGVPSIAQSSKRGNKGKVFQKVCYIYFSSFLPLPMLTGIQCSACQSIFIHHKMRRIPTIYNPPPPPSLSPYVSAHVSTTAGRKHWSTGGAAWCSMLLRLHAHISETSCTGLICYMLHHMALGKLS
jgi:hypothetical protein